MNQKSFTHEFQRACFYGHKLGIPRTPNNGGQLVVRVIDRILEMDSYMKRENIPEWILWRRNNEEMIEWADRVKTEIGYSPHVGTQLTLWELMID
jgi:hypothetical protein